jgi:UDP:flavonoid glycosyltransferase YjiC (YdhE family)
MIEELIEACKEADVLISLPYQLAGRIVHELTNIPLVTVHLSPFGGYSRRFAATTSHMINRLRSSYDLKPLEDILGVGGSSPILALYAVTPKLFRRPKHWPPHHVMTGFFFSPDESALHPELEAFLDNGDRPIVVSFGSVLHDSPVKLADLIIGSIRMTGMRAVIQRGWSDLQFSNTPDNIHITGFASHHKLFPRASCVVHAGGAGTTAATLKSGVPAVIVPHVLDQFLWANLARERGLASDVIPFPELSLRRLTSAIQAAASTPSYLNHAAAFSKSLHRENGVSAAVDLIESCIQSDQRGVVTALTTLRGDDGQRN